MFKFFIRIWTNLIFFASSDANLYERLVAFLKASWVFSIIGFLCGVLEMWYAENESFTNYAMGFVLINAVVGAIVHQKIRKFKWEIFFIKTGKMVMILTGVYFVLEGIISPLQDGVLKDGFMAAFQISTLLYPGSKILKNFYVWSDGEHPPKYIMEKIYNFKENGDLKQFLSDEPAENNKHHNED